MHHTSIYVEIRDIIDESDCDHGDSLNIMLFLFPIFSKFFFSKKRHLSNSTKYCQIFKILVSIQSFSKFLLIDIMGAHRTLHRWWSP